MYNSEYHIFFEANLFINLQLYKTVIMQDTRVLVLTPVSQYFYYSKEAELGYE